MFLKLLRFGFPLPWRVVCCSIIRGVRTNAGYPERAVVALGVNHSRERWREGTMRYVMAALLALSLGVGQAWALFETNKKLAESARIPMDQAVKQATIEVPGKAVEAQLGKEDGRTVYE